MDWAYTVSGFIVGALVGMTGVGGGALMTPLLVLGFGISPVVAVGTDLWFAAITKSVGGLLHHQRGGVDWQVFRRLCLGSLPAAVAMLLWLHYSGGEKLREGGLLTALGVVLVLTALAIVFRRSTRAWGARIYNNAPARFSRAQPALTVAAGVVLGVLVTLTSVGAGALGVVMLVYLYPLRLDPVRVVGTDIVHAIPLTLTAGLGHLWLGNVDLSLLGMLLLGSIPGIVAGSLLASRVPETVLRTAIAIILTVVGVKLLVN